MKPHQVAARARKQFYQERNHKGNLFWRTKDDTSEWIRAMCFEAHLGILMNDYSFEKIVDALDFIAERPKLGWDAMHEGAAYDFAESAVSIYTADLLGWAASAPQRPVFCDEAMEDNDSHLSKSLDAILTAGQAVELERLFHYVFEAMRKQDQGGD